MDPLVLLDKLAKLIPPPRAHQVRYFGVLAPNSHMRKQVIESAGPSAALQLRLTEAAQKMGLAVQPEGPGPKKKVSRIWAMLIARIYEVLPLLCLRCNAPMRIISFIVDPSTIVKILDHIGVPSTAPMIAPARGPPQEEFRQAVRFVTEVTTKSICRPPWPRTQHGAKEGGENTPTQDLPRLTTPLTGNETEG